MIADALTARCGCGYDRAEATGTLVPQVAGTITTHHNAAGVQQACAGLLVPHVANPLTARMHKGANTTCDEGQTLIAFDRSQITSPTNRAACAPGGSSPTLTSEAPVIAFHARKDPDCAHVSPPLDTDGQTVGLHYADGVRRLTPRECERLQGYRDDYTLVPYRGKPAKDGPRYRALGNSIATLVLCWIGERLQRVDARFRSAA